MTDVITTEPTTEPVETVEEAPAPAAPKNVAHPCLCGFYEVGNFDPKLVGTDEEEVFSTGCEQETKRQFAQGHDARLVAFLVDGYFDGYSIRHVKDGVTTDFATPADAVADVSNALQTKAEKATDNRRAKAEAKQAATVARETKRAENAAAKAAEKERKAAAKAAEKADKASTPQAEVVAGSEEGDATPTPEGMVKIKVGRWSYDATVDPETGKATYTDGKGDEQTIDPAAYALLS